MVRPEEIHRGMMVCSRDGKQLGRVAASDGGGLLIEKGLLFADDHRVQLSDVDKVQGDQVWLVSDRDHLLHVEDEAVVAAALPSPGSQRAEVHLGGPHGGRREPGRKASAGGAPGAPDTAELAAGVVTLEPAGSEAPSYSAHDEAEGTGAPRGSPPEGER